MSCPYLTNNTRECITKFKGLVTFSSLPYCNSEKYKKCIFYKSLTKTGDRCKFADKCIEIHINTPTFTYKINLVDLNQIGEDYCFTDNRKNCAIYKKLLTNKEISPYLHPDGTYLKKMNLKN